jgi:hypothetical protein
MAPRAEPAATAVAAERSSATAAMAASEAMVETAELVEVPAPLWVLARSA